MSRTSLRSLLMVFTFVASLVCTGGVGLAQRASGTTLIAYGDTRFTDPTNVTATNPRARAALIARIVVIAGHIHNYERFAKDSVVYLVSGGGGADPHEIDRTQPDLYTQIDFPNYHYARLTIGDGKLKGQMYRLDEPSAPMPHFTLKDAFEAGRQRRTGFQRRPTA